MRRGYLGVESRRAFANVELAGLFACGSAFRGAGIGLDEVVRVLLLFDESWLAGRL